MSGGVPTPAQQIFAVSGSAFPNNATQAEVRFEWTPTGTAGALDYAAFQRCMLFAGNLNLAFEPTRFADELLRCQRYYLKTFPYETAPAQNAGTSNDFRWSSPTAGTAGASSPTLECALRGGQQVRRELTGAAGLSEDESHDQAPFP
jgi:hypothetical protein